MKKSEYYCPTKWKKATFAIDLNHLLRLRSVSTVRNVTAVHMSCLKRSAKRWLRCFLPLSGAWEIALGSAITIWAKLTLSTFKWFSKTENYFEIVSFFSVAVSNRNFKLYAYVKLNCIINLFHKMFICINIDEIGLLLNKKVSLHIHILKV